MQYTSTITSKGGLTLPAKLRRQLGFAPGTRIDIQKDAATNTVTISHSLTWEELQQKNQEILKRNGHWPLKPAQTGDGFSAYVKEKYGK